MAVQSIDAQTIVWFRFLFAFIFMFFFYACFDRKAFQILHRPPWRALGAGIFLGLNYYAFLVGLDLTSPSNAQIMIQAAPFGLAITGIFLFKEKITNLQTLGFLFTPIGFYLFYRDQLSVSLLSKQFVDGNMWLIFAAVTWIIYSVWQKQLGRNFSPDRILWVVFAVNSLLFLPFAHFSSLEKMNISNWILLSSLGLSTVIAYMALAFALQYSPASQVSMIITINPLLTIFLMNRLAKNGVTWISPETIRPLGYIGAAIVVFGIALTIYRPKPKTLKSNK